MPTIEARVYVEGDGLDHVVSWLIAQVTRYRSTPCVLVHTNCHRLEAWKEYRDGSVVCVASVSIAKYASELPVGAVSLDVVRDHTPFPPRWYRADLQIPTVKNEPMAAAPRDRRRRADTSRDGGGASVAKRR